MTHGRIIVRKPNGEPFATLGDFIANHGDNWHVPAQATDRKIYSYAERVVRDLNAAFTANQMAYVAAIEEI